MPSTTTHFFPSWRHLFAGLSHRPSTARPREAQATLSQIEQRFAPALPASLLAQNSAHAHSRERIYTLARTVWSWLWQVLQAYAPCREAVRQIQALFALHQIGTVDEATSAYCQARGKIPEALLQKLFATGVHSAEAAAPPPAQRPLQNRPIRVVDASGTRLPNTRQNRAAYPPSANLPPGTGFPYLRIVVLFSLLSGAILAQATGSLHDSELRLFLRLFSHLKPKDIVLGDCAYGSFVVAALLGTVGVDLISIISTHRRRIDFRRARRRLGPADGIFVWQKPHRISPLCSPAQWKTLPQTLEVRMLRVRLQRRGFRTVTLTIVTTLLDAQLYPAAEIVAVPARRWRLEMCFDDLKTTLGMEALRSQSPAMVRKELLIFLIAHNLLRWLLAQAARHGEVPLEVLSFKGSLDGFRQWAQAIVHGRKRSACQRLWRLLLQTIAADQLPHRPGRREPRAVKKRSKYPHLNKPRHSYVQRWSRNKRRRVQTAKRNGLVN
jgi:hypothetical protein